MTSPVIDATLLLPTLLAAAAYTLTPGPAFLALLGIGATQGRRAGIGFLAGHLAGDVVWASLALIAIIGAQSLGTMVFDLLGLACGLYLCWLGWKAASTRRDADPQAALGARRPLVRGLTFGLMNPKGYPVAVATFTSLLASRSQDLSWEHAASPAGSIRRLHLGGCGAGLCRRRGAGAALLSPAPAVGDARIGPAVHRLRAECALAFDPWTMVIVAPRGVTATR
jgi:threonine/homoserine/homoserine lactone efflux protein